MEKKQDKTAALLGIFQKISGSPGGGMGMRVVTVKTTEPDDVTLAMEGTKEALDLDLFEVAVDLYPLRAGDQLLAFPLVSVDDGRWALLAKINGGSVTMATMKSATSLQPDGMTVTYDSSRLLIPPFFAVGAENSQFTDTDGKTSDKYLKDTNIRALKSGDSVSITPTMDGDKIKYIILNKY